VESYIAADLTSIKRELCKMRSRFLPPKPSFRPTGLRLNAGDCCAMAASARRAASWNSARSRNICTRSCAPSFEILISPPASRNGGAGNRASDHQSASFS